MINLEVEIDEGSYFGDGEEREESNGEKRDEEGLYK